MALEDEPSAYSLNEQLERLEILSTTTCAKKLNRNPFCVDDLNSDKKLFKYEEIFGHKCSCSDIERNKTKDNQEPSKILNTTLFKHRSLKRSRNSSIVKEPLLKNIGKCIHNNIVRTCVIDNRQDLGAASTSEDDIEDDDEIERKHYRLFGTATNNSMLDFKELITQCADLSITSRDSTGPLTNNYSKKCFKEVRQQNKLGDKNKNILNTINPNLNNNINNNTNLHTNSPQSSASSSSLPTAATSATSTSSASCSQQARLECNIGCDVTIDEIASYFETLVYIPKKMSTMAEMMYI